MRFFIFFLAFLYATTAQATPPTCSAANVVPIGGVIEPNGGAWRIYAQDNMHASVNLTNVTVTNPSLSTGYVQLNHACGTYIGSVVVEEDESYSKAGVEAGASEDNCWIKIAFGQNGTAISPNAAAAIAGSPNLWIWGYTCGPITSGNNSAYSVTLPNNEDVWDGYNLVVRIPAARFTNIPGGTPTYAQLVFDGATTEPAGVGGASICNEAATGDIYDCAAAPVPLKYGGATSFTIPQSGTLSTDNAPFVWDKTSNVLVKFYFNGGSSADTIKRANATGYGSLFYKVGSDETGTADVSGYSASASNPNATAVVKEIKMDGY